MAHALKMTTKQDGPLIVLGLESSCDETAASVLRRDKDGRVELLSNIVASQDEEHRPFGGVVPEIAARAHMRKIEAITAKAVRESGLPWEQIDGIAATADLASLAGS
jgi:N6-L-threonylcarbamoyladenine synthase